MIFKGQIIDASKFRKHLLSLSQGDLCGDCLAVVLCELDDFPKLGIMSELEGTLIGNCFNCSHVEHGSKIGKNGWLNCPKWGRANVDPYGFCHMWEQKE